MNRSVARFLALVFALLFISAAILQYNDPDPFVWILFYAVAAISCLLFFLNRFYPILGLILGVIYLLAAFWVWPETYEGISIGSGDIENIERGREALGLLIVSVLMLFFAWQARSKIN